MTVDSIKKMSRADALAKFDELKTGSTEWAKDFNSRYFKAQNGSRLADPTFDTMRALQSVAFAPPTDQEQAAAKDAAAKRKAEAPPADVIAEARFELQALKGSKDFWVQFTDPNNVGHSHAKATWEKLHSIVYGHEPIH